MFTIASLVTQLNLLEVTLYSSDKRKSSMPPATHPELIFFWRVAIRCCCMDQGVTHVADYCVSDLYTVENISCT